MNPDNTQVSLRLLEEFVLFNADGWATLSIEVTLVKGAPLSLYDGSEGQVTVGVRSLVLNEAGEVGDTLNILNEFRSNPSEVLLNEGDSAVWPIEVFVDPASRSSLVLEFDLIKEQHFWFCDADFNSSITRTVHSRPMIGSVDNANLSDNSNFAEQEREFRLREKRSEVIIFSLLNSLKKFADQKAA